MIKEAIQYILDVCQAGSDPAMAERGHFVIAPNGYNVHDLTAIADKTLERPIRKEAIVKLTDIASFVEYFKRADYGSTVMFGSRTGLSVAATFDYHGAGAEAANWRKHTAMFTLTHTEEWKVWLSSSGTKMTQEAFATFIEDNAPDIFEPKAAVMLDMARQFEATTKVSFVSGIRLKDGQQQLQYVEDVQAKSGRDKIDIPDVFKIKLIPFEGCAPCEVVARLRYRIKDGKLELWYDLHRPHEVSNAAFDYATKTIQEQTGASILFGSAA